MAVSYYEDHVRISATAFFHKIAMY